MVSEVELRAIRVSPEQKEVFLKDVEVPKRVEPTYEEKEFIRKKRKLELDALEADLAKQWAEIKKSECLNRELEIRVREKEARHYKELLEKNELIKNDAHLAAAVKDAMMLSLRQISSSSRMITNSSQSLKETFQYCPDFSALIRELELRRLNLKELQTLGKDILASFRSEFGTSPPETEKYVNGAYRRVKAYPIEHYDWLKSKVSEWCNKELSKEV